MEPIDTMFLGSDRACRFAATDKDGAPVDDATVVITAYGPDQDLITPPVTSTANLYEATVRNTKVGTWKAIPTGSDGIHVGVGLDEWRVIDPAATP
jgi:hypothetical protein